MSPLPVSNIIRDSFALAWRYKYLWLFGLFAGGGGGLNPTGSNSGGTEQVEEIKAWILAALAVILVVGFVVFVIVLVLHTICKSALIYNVYQIQTGGGHSISGGWDFGLQKFWPMLGVTLTQGLVLIGFVVTLALIEIVIWAMHWMLGVFSLMFAVPAFLVGVVMIVITWAYAERFAALEQRGVIESIGEGWSLFKKEWRPSVTMLLVKLAITIAVAVAAIMIGLIFVLPAIGIWAVSKPLAIVYGILILAPIVILIGAYFGTFDSTAWTKTFLHLRAPAYAGIQVSRPIPPSTFSSEPSAPPLFE